ncbi:MAG: 3-dehydroquinate synthase [Candidatus Schekmanbacteria bacterium]|nr:3-dehydroquinate synthase [Candidatus Schekmanbacteria bacterium]
MHKIVVNLKDRTYPIHVGTGILSHAGEIVASFSPHKVMVITNPLVQSLVGNKLQASLQKAGLKFCRTVVPDGERYKTLSTAKRLYDEMIKNGIERDSMVIALGGGVIGDLAGFVASTFMRGIPFIQIPTTLLAQVDASIGGKVAVDHPAGKNLIGSFYQPKAVIIDCSVLDTLNIKDFKNGLAEVIKTAAIRDEGLFSLIEKNLALVISRDSEMLQDVVRRTCSHKAKVVSTDEREGGIRAILNYGHTFGHALETLGGYSRLKHGEAVMAGMILAARLALQTDVCSHETAFRQENLIRRVGLNRKVFSFKAGDVMGTMSTDKKKKSGNIRFILTKKIGSAIIAGDIPAKEVLYVLKNFTK